MLSQMLGAGGGLHPCSGLGGACVCTQTPWCLSCPLRYHDPVSLHYLERPCISVSPGGTGVLALPSLGPPMFCKPSLEFLLPVSPM